MRKIRVAGFAVVCSFACSPAQEMARPPLAVANSAVPAPPKPVRARWWIDGAPYIRAQIAVGDELLSVGDEGRRTMHRKGSEAAPRQAGTILPDDLRGVLRRDDGSFVVIGAKGRTYVTADPLGAPIEEHEPPKGEVHGVAAGKSALLAIVDRAVMRSLDWGKTWTKVAYDLDMPSFPSGVALLPTGVGLLASMPQRLLFTSDDGATWTRIGSPGVGLFGVVVQGQTLGLEGIGGLRRFQPDTKTFVEGKGSSLEYPRREWVDSSSERSRALLGDRVAVAYSTWSKDEKSIVLFGVGPMGEEKSVKRLELLDGCGSVAATGHGDHLAIVCAREAPSEHVLYESRDAGASFHESSRVPVSGWQPARTALVGPDGYVFGEFVCPESGPCGAQIRPAKAKAFSTATFAEPIAFVLGAAIDPAKHRVLAVVRTMKDRVRLMEAPLDGAALSFVAGIDADATNVSTFTRTAIATDGSIVRVFLQQATSYDVLATDGSVSHLAKVGDVAFAGKRGLATVGPFEALESDDAGATWIKVPAPANLGRPLACTDVGCVFAHVERAGWELPALPKSGAIAAKEGAVPPPDDAAALPPAKLPDSVPTFTCTPEGGWTKVAAPAAVALDLSPDVRAMSAAVVDAGRAVAVVVHARKAPETIELLAPEKLDPKKHRRSVTRAFVDHAGAIAYRYAFDSVEKGATYSPVDVTVAWVTASTGKVHRASFKADPFRVATTSGAANSGIGVTESGLWLHADPAGKEAFFVANDGKVDKRIWPLPTEYSGLSGTLAHASFFDVGKRVVAIRTSYGNAKMAWLGEDKSWSPEAWSLAPSYYDHVDLSRGDGRAWLLTFPYAFANAYEGFAFPLDAPADDPPPPRIVDLRGFRDGTMPGCEDKAMSAPHGTIHIDRSLSLAHPVVVEGVEATPIVVGAMSATVHLTEKGGCLGVLRAAGRWINAEPFVAIVPVGDAEYGWLQRGKVDKSNMWNPLANVELRRIRCKASTAKPPPEFSPKDAY
ncbi:MAG: WD40/YVTN/BNR-like repeat-containing protein [Polyangiales bacterium]